ncbi:MAG: class I SAM-dependent methyltransferase [Candidatus Marinimicrobia bacterium]|nr:class I SAM-dependent methyltransferase [Candidatus Neomarinimicrobiota bacterium]
MKKLSNWENKKGVNFLKKVGIKKGFKVLDFGANDGNYTIPASNVVGRNGIVFAIDENKSALNELKKKSKFLEFDNIEIINTNGKLKLDFADNSIDFAMLYDVLHYLNSKQRKILYKEIFRILKKDATLSIHPKHIIGNFPLMELQNVTLQELINEIENIDFKYSKKICGELSHDEHLENGCTINFMKSDK